MFTKLKNPRIAIPAAIAVVAALFAAVYLTVFSPDSPSRLTLEKGATVAAPAGDASGAWTVGTGSVAGYRVREKLAALPAQSDAVGRTSAITGRAVLAGGEKALMVESATFTADVSKLTSDSGRRDGRIHTVGLETDRYPEASFTAAAPIAIPAEAIDGTAATVPAAGDLTLHGTTRRVTIPLQVQRDGALLKVVGSLQFPWSDFGMSAPSFPPFVTVESNPTLEFSLVLTRAAASSSS